WPMGGPPNFGPSLQRGQASLGVGYGESVMVHDAGRSDRRVAVVPLLKVHAAATGHQGADHASGLARARRRRELLRGAVEPELDEPNVVTDGPFDVQLDVIPHARDHRRAPRYEHRPPIIWRVPGVA